MLNRSKKIFSTISLALLLTVAGSASALVTIDATLVSPVPTAVGQMFDVEITATWDGSGSLQGIFASHVWDNSELALVSATFLPAPSFESAPTIFIGGVLEPSLMRFGPDITAGFAGDDLSNSARTLQYGSIDPLPATSAQTTLITRLTFQLLGFGDGTVNIDGAFLPADIGALGDSFTFGSNVSFPSVPEPGTVLLLGLGLACLGWPRRRMDDVCLEA